MGLVIPGKQTKPWTRRRMIELGIWRSLLPGIYWEGTRSPTVADFARAALRWAGPDALLAGTTAAHLHRFEDHWPALPLTVMVPLTRRLRSTHGVVVLRSPLEGRDATKVNGWPCTAPVRTLIDCAATATEVQLAAALDFAWRADPHVPSELLWRLGSGVAGATRLREVVFAAIRRRRPFRSYLEFWFWQLLVAAGLPLPEIDVRVCDDLGVMYLDFVYPLRGLVIETDGRKYHGQDRFEDDRLRDQRLAALGWIVFKVTWKQLREDPQGVIRRLKEMLAKNPEVRRRPVFVDSAAA